MKVFFGTTTKEILKYKDYYFAIRKELIKSGCIILDDWLQKAYDLKLSNPTAVRNKKKNYQKIVEAIDKADFVVIEYTVPNFSSSHQIIYANMRRKPVLVLRLEKDNSFKDSYLEWIESDFITIKDYDLKTLPKIIEKFKGTAQLELGLKRYNVVLDRKQKYYLDWAHSNEKRSRSEIIRDALNNWISKDTNYQRYLN